MANFIGNYSSLLKHFSSVDFLQIEDNKQDALRKGPVIAPFALQFQTTFFEKV